MTDWYISRKGLEMGPYSREQLEELALEGGITKDDLLWSEELVQWTSAGEVPGLFAAEKETLSGWYLLRDDKRYGPYTTEDLQQMSQEGNVLQSDLLWSEELGQWTPAAQASEMVAPLSVFFETSPVALAQSDIAQKPVQKRKIWPFLLVVLVVLAVTVFAGFNLLGGKVSLIVGSPSMEAVVCQRVDGDSRPIETTDTFSLGDDELYVSVTVDNVREGSKLVAEWRYLDEDEDVILIRYERELDRGDNRVHFSIVRPPFGWFEGNYEAILILDDDLEVTLPFAILKP